ncbi:MAG: thioredoxin fold domain-containing protein [Dysgonamonadaceae bacterium]|jgi:protein-disulfide isomerase|nr:thioredoxin fold domain-containing protein [Dysgonamonadaceae bacterium]
MRPKKIIVLSTILIVLCSSAFLLHNIVQKNQKTKDVYRSIPEFQLSDLKGNNFTNDSLQVDKSTLFLFFDPDCESCEEEFEQIKINRDFLLDYNMIFVSTLPESVILNFLKRIDFQPNENMFFLCDKKAELSGKMNVRGIPSALIYNKNGKLIKNYTGLVKIETLIKYLSE